MKNYLLEWDKKGKVIEKHEWKDMGVMWDDVKSARREEGRGGVGMAWCWSKEEESELER